MSFRFSIVTACLNRASLIATAIDSVRAQNWPDVEHIVVDGGSSDGTLELLARYPHLRVVSGPDAGVFDAWNKGIALATGDAVAILNSDDLYAPDVFRRVAAAFDADPSVEIVSGHALNFVERDPTTWDVVYEHRESPGPTLAVERLAVWGPCINARFVRRETLAKFMPFDLRYSLGSDNEFFLRLAHARPRAAYIDDFVYYYRTHAGSLSMDPGQRNLLRGTRLTLDVAEAFLAREDLSPAERRHVLEHHAVRVVANAIAIAKRGDLAAAAGLLARGLTVNPAIAVPLWRRWRRRRPPAPLRQMPAPALFKRA